MERGHDGTPGSLVYAGFAAAMTVGRFGGGFFLERFGKAAVVRAGAISATRRGWSAPRGQVS
ncbi:hypothetical protein KN815_17645 [Streptomyces sp. 4503]|uniref:MFS transporter n=1 Tax=Streptomyces niphimycinicus TaxID=2842201 RepID=A0ABS6CG32_9ACTN|nr:hypothetical protein [Streptomyces niphimycinicus]MBU3865829.1 hypothetical protein [Streptomyces niphimycinicus]